MFAIVVGWGDVTEKISLGQLVYGPTGQKYWWSWHKIFAHSKQGSPQYMVLEICFKERIPLETSYSQKFWDQ